MSREGNEKLKELFERGIPVYSYSKLDSFGGCKYNYYLGYILKERSKDNIYSLVGSVIHDGLEMVYKDDRDIKETEKEFLQCIKEASDKGIKFPENPPTTKTNYIKNMTHFFNTYKKMDTKMITEQFVLLSIPRVDNPKDDKDYIWIQMYIDSIYPIYEEKKGKKVLSSVVVNDWKTSSKFDKNKLKSASKQLILYKMGVEQSTGILVSKVGWTMLKYVYCCSYGAKGQVKRSSLVERKDSVKYFFKSLVKDLINSELDTIEAELLVGRCVSNNTLEYLPKEIKSKYWFEDCFLEFDFNDDIIEETKQWVLDTVNSIESCGNDINKFPSVEIGVKTSYFCNVLCGRPKCKYLIEYNNDNKDSYKKDIKEDDSKRKDLISRLDSLFI